MALLEQLRSVESVKERKFKREVKVMMIYQGGRPPLYIIWFPITNLLDPLFISNHKSSKSSNSLIIKFTKED